MANMQILLDVQGCVNMQIYIPSDLDVRQDPRGDVEGRVSVLVHVVITEIGGGATCAGERGE